MSRPEAETGSVSASLYQWGAGWVEYAQQQLSSFLGTEDLEVVNPDGAEVVSSADLLNPDDERQKFWENLQEYIGHDITSLISVPVWIMEPVTLLQRMAEIMEYTELLDQADQCEDEFKRIALVLAFGVTPYGAIERPWKPFNPILGETFEVQCGNGVKFFAEQVSHHPPIGAAHAENEHFRYHIVSAPKSKFLGNSVEVYPEGRSRITLKSSNDTYYLVPPTAKACNIIIGRTWIDNYGTLSITSTSTGNTASVEFTPCGWFGQGRYEFSGYVTEAKTGLRKLKLSGKWNSYCDCVAVEDVGGDVTEIGASERLWTCSDKPDDDYYGRTRFCCQLCDDEGAPEPRLSDSRRRPDRTALDMGESVEAGGWKHRLEEAQRAEQREREKRGDKWVPRYFRHVGEANPEAVIYDGEYGLDAVGCWVWNDALQPTDKADAEEGTVVGKGFTPWQYPELHQDPAQ